MDRMKTTIDTMLVLVSSIMFYFFGKNDKELSRREGIYMVIVFISYYIYVFFS